MNFRHILSLSCALLALLNLASASLAAEKRGCCQKELPAATALPDTSLYQLTSTWTNDASVSMPLSGLRGRPQVITMFFANCEFACPLLVSDMKRIEAALPESVRTNTGLVLVSFDGRRDTPAALATYRGAHDLNANWTLLTGGADDILELAALLGVKFKQDARGQFAHSNLITLLDAEGRVVKQQIGLNQSGEEIAAAIQRLVAPAPSLSANR